MIISTFITQSILALFNYHYNTQQQSFYAWLNYTADSEFEYIYISQCRQHCQSFLIDQDSLKVYARNLSYALQSFMQISNEYSKVALFIEKMITLQFENNKLI